MKLLVACLTHESNTFSSIPTGFTSFESVMQTRKATSLAPNLFTAPLHLWKEMAVNRGWEVVESLTAIAQPSGIIVKQVYEEYRDAILKDIEQENPDIILLSMHGAMVADGILDCEGDLLSRARSIAGDSAVIGVELDPHAHLTQTMLDSADLIILFKEYPHIDSSERAEELFVLAEKTYKKEIYPVMSAYDCRMLVMVPTLIEGPAKTFVTKMKELEKQEGILSLSLCHGFPYGDTPDTAMKMLAIADNSEKLAEDYASRLGKEFFGVRFGVQQVFPTIEQTLDKISLEPKRNYVLADYADNAGGGAPADSTFVLSEVLNRGLMDFAFGIFWDPGVVYACFDAGVGAKLKVRVGGKVGVESGMPVDLNVIVKGLKRNVIQKFAGGDIDSGDMVWLESEGNHLLVGTVRTQCFEPGPFSELGMDLAQMKAVVVKSSNHFYDAFSQYASEVIHMATPGALTTNYAAIEYKHRDGNYWPKVENPFK